MLPLLLISFVGLYVLFGLGAATTARRRRAADALPAGSLPRVSVLVAARNEEANLPRCLDALQAQRYPADRIEFLIADDHSTDRTPDLIRAMQRRDDRFRYVAVSDADSSELRGKSHALHQAYQYASSDVLLVTDADCTPPPDWARHLAAQFQHDHVGVACGVTLVEHKRLLDRLQALDWLLLLTVASAAAGQDWPLTAMGNNMAFRRAAYEDVGGYPAMEFSVTEDYALFQAVHDTPGWTVRLLLDERLRNVTCPLRSLRAVFSQRRRWARGGLDARAGVYGFYVVVFLAHLLLVAGLFAAPLVALPLLGGKLLTDFLVLKTGARRLGHPAPLRSFPLFEAYLFGYVLLMPLALLLAPRIRWKGRRF